MHGLGNAAAAVVVAASTILGGAVAMDHGHGHEGNARFDQALVGLPADQKIAIDGVPAAGAPWVVDHGSRVSIDTHGKLDMRVRGLLLTGTGGPADGTTGPVTQVVATLACANGESATTSAVPLSAAGDARIREQITVPANCLAPVVLVRIFGLAAANPWIAATGL